MKTKKTPQPERKNKIKSILYLIIQAIIFIFLLETLGLREGILGLLALWIGWAVYRLYKFRSQFMNVVRYIEAFFWGKPFDKGYWKKGERPPRVKLKWRKKKNVPRD